MSNLINQQWIGHDGEPITGRMPPRIRVLAGRITPKLMGEIAHRYHIFCMNKEASKAAYFVSDKDLPDGSRVRMISNSGLDEVIVWAKDVGGEDIKEDPGELGGFIFRPQNDVDTDGTDLTFWGKPFTPANMPLGTPGGTKPFALLSPKVSKDTVTGAYKARDTYKFHRGISPVDKLGRDVYGQIDWQGPDPETDVISWYCESVDGLVYGNSSIPDVYMDQWGIQSYEYYGDDPDKSKMLVLRKRNFGVGSVVCSKLKVIKAFPSGGLVDGAGFTQKDANGQRHMITALRTGGFAGVSFAFVKTPIRLGETKAPSGKMVPVYEAPESDAEDVVLGTYAPPGSMTNMHGWYFNQSGTKARCVMTSKDEQFAVEATFAADSVTFAEVADSRGDAGYSSDLSPAVLADFQADIGVMLQYRRIVTRPSSLNWTYSKTYPDINTTYEVFDMTQVFGHTKVEAVVTKEGAGGATQTVTPMSAADGGKTRTVHQEATSFSISDGVTDSTVSFTQTSSDIRFSPSAGILYSRVVDADLRCDAFVFHEVFGNVDEDSDVQIERRSISRPGVVDPFTDLDEMTSTRSGTSTHTRIRTVVDGVELATDWPASVSAGGTSTGPTEPGSIYTNSQIFFSYPGTPGVDSQIDAYTPNSWRNFVGATTFDSINGMVRTYYGITLSTTLVGAGMNPIPPWYENQPSKGVSHLVGGVAADAAVIAQIEAQPMPWLARLGVV